MTHWTTEYPTVADIHAASFSTLDQWDKQLPPPETDVQRTARRKIRQQMVALAGREVRKTDPEIAEKWNALQDKLESLGLPAIGRM